MAWAGTSASVAALVTASVVNSARARLACAGSNWCAVAGNYDHGEIVGGTQRRRTIVGNDRPNQVSAWRLSGRWRPGDHPLGSMPRLAAGRSTGRTALSRQVGVVSRVGDYERCQGDDGSIRLDGQDGWNIGGLAAGAAACANRQSHAVNAPASLAGCIVRAAQPFQLNDLASSRRRQVDNRANEATGIPAPGQPARQRIGVSAVDSAVVTAAYKTAPAFRMSLNSLAPILSSSTPPS